MINAAENPVAWAGLLYDMDEASEHLAGLISEMNSAGAIDESEFEIHLGHVFAHLNRIWHARNQDVPIREDQWVEFSQFPSDLQPIG